MSTYVAIGSVCWDVVEGDPAARLGGSVLFSSRVAVAAGWDSHVITSGTPSLEAALRVALPGVTITVQPSATDTVMAFSEHAELGPQAVPSRAAPIDVSLVGLADLDADVVHLAPILDEVTPGLVDQVRHARFIGITPQGLLRSTDPETHALVRRPHLEPWWASSVHAAVMSEDEFELVGSPADLDRLLLAVTRGEQGCFGRCGGEEISVPGIELRSVAPVGTIGAGDVFAAAFFMALADGASFDDSLHRANRTAAAHVSGQPVPT